MAQGKTTDQNIMGTMPMGELMRRLSTPMIASVVIDSLYQTVDTIFIGMTDPKALSAMSVATPLCTIMLQFAFGLSIGCNTILSHRLGQGRRDDASQVAGNSLVMAIGLYVIFALVGLFAVGPFFRFQTDDAQIIDLGTAYATVTMVFSLGLMVQTTCERLLSSTGRTSYSMVLLMTGSLMNLAVDPILIFGLFGAPKLGITGAAISTVVAQHVAAAVGIVLNVRKNPEIGLRLKALHLKLDVVREVVTVAIPATLSYSVTSIFTFAMNWMLVGMNVLAPSAYISFWRVYQLISMPVWGVRNTILSIIAYNRGAGRIDRVNESIRLSRLFSAALMAVGTVAFLLAPQLLLAIFSASPEVVEIGVPALRIMGSTLLLSGATVVFTGVFQALGHPTMSLVSSAVQAAVVVAAAFVVPGTGMLWFAWGAYALSQVAAYLTCRAQFHVVRGRDLVEQSLDGRQGAVFALPRA